MGDGARGPGLHLGQRLHPRPPLLDTLAAAGLLLRYRDDFDWPGIALANRIIRRYSAQPWRMAAVDTNGSSFTPETRAVPASRSSAPRWRRAGTPTSPPP
ncbi:DUF2399 domain-containing protein [Kitasatospora sp. NPDC093679]|uniref:DUF2399 domain-containing protein n=1 Tax=Kitasatospora sp. NPDC093679 TaxID=3154983 RepID=UPI0034363132